MPEVCRYPLHQLLGKVLVASPWLSLFDVNGQRIHEVSESFLQVLAVRVNVVLIASNQDVLSFPPHFHVNGFSTHFFSCCIGFQLRNSCHVLTYFPLKNLIYVWLKSAPAGI